MSNQNRWQVSEKKLARHNFWRSLHISCICLHIVLYLLFYSYTFYSQIANVSVFPLAKVPAAVKAIKNAIKEYHAKTCIIFKKRTEKKEPAYIEFFYGFGWVCHWDHKQPSRGILKKRCCENVQQIYRRTPTLKWNHTSAWVFSCKCFAHFQNSFS